MGLFSKKTKTVKGCTDPNAARLLIYRADKNSKELQVIIDGKTACWISGRQQKYIDIAPGVHRIAVGDEVETETNIGALDAVRIELDAGFFSSHVNLSIVPAQYAMTTYFK